MAAELNLLESLEVSVRQLTDMERTRAVSLAQQESVSLARILQSRQRDHERELQLLSLKVMLVNLNWLCNPSLYLYVKCFVK